MLALVKNKVDQPDSCYNRTNSPMPRTSAKSRQSQSNVRGPYTPQPVQGRVIALHISGHSNRQIARQEGIGRDTVGRILSQQEVVQMMAQYQSRLLTLVGKAIRIYDRALDSDDLRLAMIPASKILDHVFQKGGMEQTIELANRVSPEIEERNRRRLLLGELVEIAEGKAERYGVHAPELVRLMAEPKDRNEDADLPMDR